MSGTCVIHRWKFLSVKTSSGTQYFLSIKCGCCCKVKSIPLLFTFLLFCSKYQKHRCCFTLALILMFHDVTYPYKSTLNVQIKQQSNDIDRAINLHVPYPLRLGCALHMNLVDSLYLHVVKEIMIHEAIPIHS